MRSRTQYARARAHTHTHTYVYIYIYIALGVAHVCEDWWTPAPQVNTEGRDSVCVCYSIRVFICVVMMEIESGEAMIQRNVTPAVIRAET